MTKKLCTVLLTALAASPVLMAQEPACCGADCASFAPKKGQWEVSLMLGKSNAFYNENNTYLLPNISMSGSSVGLPNGGDPTQIGQNGIGSGYLNQYLNIDGFNGNSLVNIVGVQGKYFWQDCWSLSFSGGLNIGVTPQKNYVEPTLINEDEAGKPTWELPSQKYINATATNNWYVNVGMERYFKTGNKRIFPYVGVQAGFQMARVETREPYTGKMVNIYDNTPAATPALGADVSGEIVEEQVYIPAGKIGQMFGIKGAAVAGVEYDLMPGMFLALEFQPVSYRYDVIQIAPQGFDHYNLNHHNIKVFDMPTLRIGFRF